MKQQKESFLYAIRLLSEQTNNWSDATYCLRIGEANALAEHILNAAEIKDEAVTAIQQYIQESGPLTKDEAAIFKAINIFASWYQGLKP